MLIYVKSKRLKHTLLLDMLIIRSKNNMSIEEFPIIGFYLYHVTSAGQSSNWTTSGIYTEC